jgi:FtsZ-interacting cell division protein ZipA
METNNNAQGKGAFSQLNKNKMQHNDPNNPYAGSIAPPPVETNQQEQTHGQAHQQPQVQEQQQPQPQVQSVQQSAQASSVQQKNATYFFAGNEQDGFIELDLVSQRYKGEESRYLSVFLNGFSFNEQNETVNTTTAINIKTEEDFNNFKEFVSNLNWND